MPTSGEFPPHPQRQTLSLVVWETVPLPKGVRIALVDEAPPFRPLTTERRRLRHWGRNEIARLAPRQVWHFAAEMRGEPVGETSLCLEAGVAGLYDVEVIERCRKRGIGTALVWAVLRHAKKLGCRAAVLGATGMGQGLYTRLGFREVGKLSFWKYGRTRQLTG